MNTDHNSEKNLFFSFKEDKLLESGKNPTGSDIDDLMMVGSKAMSPKLSKKYSLAENTLLVENLCEVHLQSVREYIFFD